MKNSESITHNIRVHNKLALQYEKKHTEIFNEVEQNRLKRSLSVAKENVRTSPGELRALDVGCGSGNLTGHLLSLNFSVTAADISEHFLNLVIEKYGSSNTETCLLNGKDLASVESNTFDLVAAYSVLHHIPDYLGMVREMVRVTRPGGVVYIDHEKNENYWSREEKLFEFLNKQNPYIMRGKWKRLFSVSLYLNRLKRVFNPRYQAEGDIHVFLDDHIEWDKIKEVFAAMKVEVVAEEDYLNYNALYSSRIYREYRDMTSDTKLIIGRKRQNG